MGHTWVRITTAVGLVMALGCTGSPRDEAAAIARDGNQASSPEVRDKTWVAQIPFEIVDDLIMIQVSVNGTETIDMILDTGFGSPGAILLDPKIGEQLGLRYVTQLPLGGGGVDVVTADVAVGATLDTGGLDFPNQNLMVLTDGDMFDDWLADGIIGGTLFAYVVEINYESSLVNLYEDIKDLQGDPGEAFELTYTSGIPVIEGAVAVDGSRIVPVKLITDTGVNDPLLIFSYTDDRLSPPEHTLEGVTGVLSEGLNGEILGETGRISTLKIGPFVLNDVIASFPDSATWGSAHQLGRNGMLGNEILQRFRVVFDYLEDRMYLTPNTRYAEPFEFNMAGLVLQVTGERRLLVTDVIRNSPGEREGISVGDEIVGLNGRDIDEYTWADVRDLFTRHGKSLNLTVERDGAWFSESVKLERLI